MATTVLITGANRGLGRALVDIFLSRPNHTVIAGVRDPSAASVTSLKAYTAAEGSKVIVVKLESTSPEDHAAAIKTIMAAGVDHLDVVIANAGISEEWDLVENMSIDYLRKVFDVHAVGTVLLYQATLPLLRATSHAKGAGKPIFIGVSTIASSMAILKDNTPYLLGAYGASKAAVNYLVRRASFENEWLNAFVVDPGLPSTDMALSVVDRFGVRDWLNPVEDSAEGIVKHIDNPENTSGKFLHYKGNEVPF